MFHYFIKTGNVLIHTDDWSKVKKTSTIEDATKVTTHLEYPNGIILDCILTIDGADITINRELILNDNGDYVLKED